jgi:hypothetical protein
MPITARQILKVRRVIHASSAVLYYTGFLSRCAARYTFTNVSHCAACLVRVSSQSVVSEESPAGSAWCGVGQWSPIGSLKALVAPPARARPSLEAPRTLINCLNIDSQRTDKHRGNDLESKKRLAHMAKAIMWNPRFIYRGASTRFLRSQRIDQRSSAPRRSHALPTALAAPGVERRRVAWTSASGGERAGPPGVRSGASFGNGGVGNAGWASIVMSTVLLSLYGYPAETLTSAGSFSRDVTTAYGALRRSDVPIFCRGLLVT